MDIDKLTIVKLRLRNKLHLLSMLPAVLFMLVLYNIGEPYIYEVMSDPIVSLNGEVWTGFGSNLGVILWLSSASISIFVGYQCLSASRARAMATYLLMLGCLTLALAIDDFFLVHDIILPYLGINEIFLYLIYAISMITIVLKFLDVISETENIIFFIGGGLFAGSIFIDILPANPLLGFIEDALKLIGIFSWSYYLTLVSKQVLSMNTNPKES